LDVDVIMMQDGSNPHGSISNMFMRYSERTRALLDAWLAAAAPDSTPDKVGAQHSVLCRVETG
jgi:hypothetical protein